MSLCLDVALKYFSRKYKCVTLPALNDGLRRRRKITKFKIKILNEGEKKWINHKKTYTEKEEEEEEEYVETYRDAREIGGRTQRFYNGAEFGLYRGVIEESSFS